MKPFIVVSDGFDKNQFEVLCNSEEFEVYPERKISQDTLRELLPKISGLIIRSATTMNQELIDMAPNLKLIIRAGEGTDNIDKKYCGEKNINVANTPGANNNSAAEHAIALMMTVLRKTAWANQSMTQGKWDKALFAGNELANKKVGIVGFGRIGQIVTKRIAGFEPDVLFYDPFIEESDIPYANKAKDLAEIFSTCEVISVHTPLMDATRGMITKELLNSMRSDAILVNASRGGIVDEDALFEVLKEKKIRAAGFDVFAQEPLPEDSKLRILDNLVMTPHLGASTEEAQIRVGAMAVHQMKEFFINNNLLNQVKG